jgi:hypothetical protein
MTLKDRFKSKKILGIFYKKSDLEELLKLELTDLEYVMILQAWNDDLNNLDIGYVDAVVEEWFSNNFNMKIEPKNQRKPPVQKPKPKKPALGFVSNMMNRKGNKQNP